MSTIKKKTIAEYVNKDYREFWKDSNQNKNTFFASEQVTAIERHVMFAARQLHMKAGDHHKTVALGGEASKYHMANNEGIMDFVKMLAQNYRREPACRVLYPIGNLGDSPDNKGAAARYTSVGGTPLAESVIEDMDYCDWDFDSRMGVKMPVKLSYPYPMALVNGYRQVGVGHSNILASRSCKDIIDYLEKRFVDGEKDVPIPEPNSINGCEVLPANEKGYITYRAKWHREGKYDVITALPPRIKISQVLAKLRDKLPVAKYNAVFDGSGEGEPVKLMIPKGTIDDMIDDGHAYACGFETYLREQIFIWDEEIDTMRGTTVPEIAELWFTARKETLSRKLTSTIEKLTKESEKIDLIREFVTRGMIKKSQSEIEDVFGKENTNILLSMPAKTFLPENLGKQELKQEMINKDIQMWQGKLENINRYVIEVARDVATKNEEFFKQLDEG